MSRFIVAGLNVDVASTMTDLAANRPAVATVDIGTIFVASDTGAVSIATAAGWVPIPSAANQHSVSPATTAEAANVVDVRAVLLDANGTPVVGALVELVSDDNTPGVVYGPATIGTLLYAASAIGTVIKGITGAGGILSVPATFAGALVQTWRASAPAAPDSGVFTATATWT